MSATTRHSRVAAILLAALTGCDGHAEHAALRSVLDIQAAAWNRGDVDAFMNHYVKSDELTFSSGGSTTRGWEATRGRYRRRYPDRDAMGYLEFSGLESTLLAPDAALVLGRWKLTRENGDLGGNFSLVFQKVRNRWIIRHDHTSTETSDE